jgi:delta24(24(1))-sterol reductase
MAFSWGFACGFSALLPYYYVIFFSGMIVHRVLRDEDKCS